MADGQVIALPKRKRRKSDSNSPTLLSRCITDSTGKAVPNHANALLFLRLDPKLCDCFAYDEMQETGMLMCSLPGAESVAGRSLTDNDTGIVQEYLQREGIPRLSRDAVHHAIDQRAREQSFHPVRNFLDELEWDGHPRLSHWLETYCGVAPSPYTQAIGRMFLIGMCARVFEPGCKMDYMPVLEGSQGSGKSTVCRILGGEYYSDALPDITSGKDASQHLRGKWLVEVAELSALGKAEAAALKAFLSRQVERYRPPYGRLEVMQPRQCCFIGTTNKTAYLRDETGGRRFWPLKVGKIDLDALARDRDQLFAEARRLYDGGIAWWPNGQFEREHILKEQEFRFEADVWEEIIRRFLATKQQVLVGEVARDALGISAGRIGRAEQNRIVAILERLGWERQCKDSSGNKPWKRGCGHG